MKITTAFLTVLHQSQRLIWSAIYSAFITYLWSETFAQNLFFHCALDWQLKIKMAKSADPLLTWLNVGSELREPTFVSAIAFF
jgi:hypothetical protein